ncbi:MAG: copper resistance CopC family protein [Cycloclasticus sp.]
MGTDPAPRSTLSRPPESINILFNQLFEPAYSSITVKRADGSVLATEKASVDPSNQKRLVLLLPVLPAGQYTVSYKVLSLDGHTISSTYSFRIKKENPRPH